MTREEQRKRVIKTRIFNPIFKNDNIALDLNYLTGSLDNQLKKQGYEFTIDSYSFEDIRRSTFKLYYHGYITDNGAERIYTKLFNDMFKYIKPSKSN